MLPILEALACRRQLLTAVVEAVGLGPSGRLDYENHSIKAASEGAVCAKGNKRSQRGCLRSERMRDFQAI